jgi:hypothetical protein
MAARRGASSWARFARALRAELSPAPDPPGVTPLSPVDPARWERLAPAQVRHAAQQALFMAWADWATAVDFVRGRRPRLAPPAEEGGGGAAGAGDGGAAGAAGAAAAAAAGALPGVTAAGARAAALALAARVGGAARDEELRARVAAAGSEALALARDALDEFLVGYAEGKGDEVRAFIAEELEREAGFVERVKRLRAAVRDEEDARAAAAAAAAAAPAPPPAPSPAPPPPRPQ